MRATLNVHFDALPIRAASSLQSGPANYVRTFGAMVSSLQGPD